MRPAVELVQFKLTSGEEIIAEVLEWPENPAEDIVLRHAYQLTFDFSSQGVQKMGLKPWMMFQEGHRDFILMTFRQIVATAKPTRYFVKEYQWAKSQNHFIQKERKEYYDGVDANTDRLLKEALEKISNLDSDSLRSNIIPFPHNKNIH